MTVLGVIFADERVFNDLIDTDFSESYQYYYDNIIGPYAHPSMANALKKIEPLEIELIANGHGPVLRKDIPHYIELYQKWSAPVVRENKQVVIAYASCYGYTKMLAEKIAEGIRHAGIDNLKVLDLETTDLEEAGKQLQQADGFLLGSPTLVADALPPCMADAYLHQPYYPKRGVLRGRLVLMHGEEKQYRICCIEWKS